MNNIKFDENFKKDFTEFFKLSGALQSKKLTHHPFIVFKTIKESDQLVDLQKAVEHAEFYLQHCKDMTKWGESKYESDKENARKAKEDLPIKEKELEIAKKNLEEGKKIYTDKEIIKIELVDNASDLINYRPETPVIAQWKGEWRSDFFRFTVNDYHKFVTSNL